MLTTVTLVDVKTADAAEAELRCGMILSATSVAVAAREAVMETSRTTEAARTSIRTSLTSTPAATARSARRSPTCPSSKSESSPAHAIANVTWCTMTLPGDTGGAGSSKGGGNGGVSGGNGPGGDDGGRDGNGSGGGSTGGKGDNGGGGEGGGDEGDFGTALMLVQLTYQPAFDDKEPPHEPQWPPPL